MNYEWHTHEFPPLFNSESRILILGSFPSVKSREQKFYYGHPRNRFWGMMAELTGEPFPPDIPARRALALRHGIALWDVIEKCEIRGSSDRSIRSITPTDLNGLLERCAIRQIYANGRLAEDLYIRYQQERTGRSIIGLPSSSPANAAWSSERLLEAWSVIRQDLPGEIFSKRKEGA